MVVTASGLIRVDRAIFGSSNHGAIEGYQLLSWSEGVDARTNKELCQWAPTRLGSLPASGWSVQVFHSSSGRTCISRTFAAGQEYSQRGSLNVASVFLTLEPTHWARYHFDALAVFRIAMALGYMRWTQPTRKTQLSEAILPAEPPLTSEDQQHLVHPAQSSSFPVDEIADRLERGDRVALVGVNNSVSLIGQIISCLPLETRRRLTFTSGLPLSIHRPFQLHCLDRATYTQQPGLVDWLADRVYGT